MSTKDKQRMLQNLQMLDRAASMAAGSRQDHIAIGQASKELEDFIVGMQVEDSNPVLDLAAGKEM